MRHTLLIVAAIAPLAVIASPATTTTGSIPGSGHTQMSGNINPDAVAVRRARAKAVDRRQLNRRANTIRPRTNFQGFQGEGPGPGGET
jgi:hypothetical protein